MPCRGLIIANDTAMSWTVCLSKKGQSLREPTRGISLELPSTVGDFHSRTLAPSDPHNTRTVSSVVCLAVQIVCLQTLMAQMQVTSSSTLQHSLGFCPKRLKLVYPSGHPDDEDRPSPAPGATWAAGAGQ